MRFCAAAVPSPRRNSTSTSGSPASAFSVPFRAIVQKSAALFVMKASFFVDDRPRPQPLTASRPRQTEGGGSLYRHSILLTFGHSEKSQSIAGRPRCRFDGHGNARIRRTP